MEGMPNPIIVLASALDSRASTVHCHHGQLFCQAGDCDAHHPQCVGLATRTTQHRYQWDCHYPLHLHHGSRGDGNLRTIQRRGVSIEDIRNPQLIDALENSTDPLRQFLSKHSSDSEREFFTQTTQKLWPEKYSKEITNDHLLVLIPSFMVSELTTAFQVGFLIFLPFVVIDLVISNLLMSMGMMMLSPMTISLPFKLLLFVLVDGWSRLIHGLILSY